MVPPKRTNSWTAANFWAPIFWKTLLTTTFSEGQFFVPFRKPDPSILDYYHFQQGCWFSTGSSVFDEGKEGFWTIREAAFRFAEIPFFLCCWRRRRWDYSIETCRIFDSSHYHPEFAATTDEIQNSVVLFWWG
jgi:hypothetical protein